MSSSMDSEGDGDDQGRELGLIMLYTSSCS